MTRGQALNGLIACVASALLFTGVGAANAAEEPPWVLDVQPSFELPLDGTAIGRAGDAEIEAELAAGATFVESVEGQGLAPGAEGPSATIPLPPELWGKEGTLAFRFRTSRALRGRKENRQSMALVDCPVFKLSLVERADAIRLRLNLKADGSMTHQQALNRFALGNLDLSHLDAGKWYHLAISWSAKFPDNRLEVSLNGAAQQNVRPGRAWWWPWRLPKEFDPKLTIGGLLGEGDDRAEISVDSLQLYPRFMYAEDVAATLRGRPNFALTGEGRWDYEGSLDLTPYRLTPVYETAFDQPLNVVEEADLFDGDKRVRVPDGTDWVFEHTGAAKVWTEDGFLSVLTNGSHSVLWNTRVFPENVLLEFGFRPKDSFHGLTIIFFAARGVDGGSIFDVTQPLREGKFRNYTHGRISAYHTSYWATSYQDIPRRTANLRKNPDFHMPAIGIDRIGGAGPGPHRVRLLKVGNRIQLETRGRIALDYTDDGETYGPVLKDGCIGLRQMAHAQQVSYTHFKVWKVDPK